MNNRGGTFLLLSYMVIAVLTILGTSFMDSSVTERNISLRHADSVSAFWLAEAGLTQALDELRSDFSATGVDVLSGDLTVGRYSVDIEPVGQLLKVTSHGFVPSTGSVRVQRTVEAMIMSGVPEDYYGYAIYSAGDIDINGNSYSVEGSVLYADNINYTDEGENIHGEIVNDEGAKPLPYLDFDTLYYLSVEQGNYYDEARLKDIQKGNDSFPGSFWYSEPTDPEDPTTGTPNVVYVDGNLPLNGNIGTIGGFFVVVGDVLTDLTGAEPQNLTINGCGQIDGVVYTRGEFKVNGGAGGINVNGSVWAGELARLNGNTNVTYNPYFIQAIQNLDVDSAHIISWRDVQKPF